MYFCVLKIQYVCSHRIGGNRKRYQQSTNGDQKTIETAFSIAICCQRGDKWRSKTRLLTILSTNLDSIGVFDCRLPGVMFLLKYFWFVILGTEDKVPLKSKSYFSTNHVGVFQKDHFDNSSFVY